MKGLTHMKKLLILLTIALFLPAAAHAEELRGVWVASVGNIDYPSKAAADADTLCSEADAVLDNCAELGLNAVFLQVRPMCDALYPSKYFPVSAYLTGKQGLAPSGDSDIFAYWVDAAHSRGIELHAWINPYRVSNTPSPVLSADNPAKKHPEWTVRSNNSVWLDPGLPEVREYILSGIDELLKGYKLDGIHFDDYFYPSGEFDDSKSYSEYGSGMDKGDWRRSNTEDLIRRAGELCRAAHVRFGVSPCGIWANSSDIENGSATHGVSAYFDMYADTLGWAQKNLIDYIAPQIYWENGHDKADYKTLCDWWSDKLRESNTDLYIGLADYKISDDGSSPWFEGNEIEKQMEMNAQNDVIKGEIHFSYSTIMKNTPLLERIKSIYANTPTAEPAQEKAVRKSERLSELLDIALRLLLTLSVS